MHRVVRRFQGTADLRPPKPDTADAERAADALKIPAAGLIVFGAINAVGSVALALVFLSKGGMPLFFLILVILPVITGLFQLKGGLHMANHRSHSVAMAGAIAAVLPMTPLWLISLPLGIVALLVLQRRDVRQLFACSTSGAEPVGSAQQGFAAPFLMALLAALFATCMGCGLAAWLYLRTAAPDTAHVEIPAEVEVRQLENGVLVVPRGVEKARK